MADYIDETAIDYGGDKIVTDTYDYGYAYPQPAAGPVTVAEERVYYDEDAVDIGGPDSAQHGDEDESFQYHEEWSELPDGWQDADDKPDEETKVNVTWTEDDVGDSADVWMPQDALLVDGGGDYDGPDIFVGIGTRGEMYERWCELQPWECLNGANGTDKGGLLLGGDLARLWGAYDATGILLALLLLLLLLIGLNIGWDSEVRHSLASGVIAHKS